MTSSKRALDKTASIITNRPIVTAGAVLAFACLLAGIGFAVYPFNIDTTGTTFIPRSSKEYQIQETLLLAEEKTRFNPYRAPTSFDGVVIPQQTQEEYTLLVLYAVDEYDNVFTPARVQVMHDLQIALTQLGGYEDVCLKARGSNKCSDPLSLNSYFYGTPIDGCPGVFSADGDASTLSMSVEQTLTALIDPQVQNVFCVPGLSTCTSACVEPSQAEISWAVGKRFGFPDGNPSKTPNLASDVTQSIFRFGLPLAGYDSPDDRYDEQVKTIEAFIRHTQRTLDGANGREGMTVRYLSTVLARDYFWDLVIKDTMLVFASIIMVYCYMVFHLQSFFLASLGMLHVLISFPLAYLFTQMSMDFGGMGILNLMSLFIILGIGADDIFIFVDTWKQSAIEVPLPEGIMIDECFLDNCVDGDDSNHTNLGWLFSRMRWTYARACQAMLITSLTTGAAFVMNLSSSVPAIQIFGGFTAFMVFFNYVLVITYFPCIVIVYQLYCHKWCSPLSLFSKCQKEPEIAGHPTNVSKLESQKEGEKDVSEFRAIEQWFYNRYSPALYSSRWFVIVGFVVYFAISLGYATQLKASDEPTRWLPKDDPLQQTFSLTNDRFARSGSDPQIRVFYGLREVDMKGVNPYNPNDVGKTRFDYGLDLSSAAAQLRFLEICTLFREQPYVFSQQVLCPLEEVRDYVLKRGGVFPIPPQDFVMAVANFTRDYEEAEGPAPDVSGTTGSTKQDAESRADRASEEFTTYNSIRFDLYDDFQLRYLVIIINSTLSRVSTAEEIEPLYKHWDNLIKSLNREPANQATTLDGGLQTSPAYIDMVLEQTLLRAAVVGIAASMALAFAIILVLTTDLQLAVVSIVSIGGVVTSLIALIVWMGWTLSLIESICMTILVGLSVDYVIHMANAYRESNSLTRYTRARDAFVTMGISVLSASITTILCAIVLVFTVIVFFFKFGLFIMLTIIFSTLWAFGFFMAIMMICGREERRNDFRDFWRWAHFKCCPSSTHPSQYQLEPMSLRSSTQLSNGNVESTVI